MMQFGAEHNELCLSQFNTLMKADRIKYATTEHRGALKHIDCLSISFPPIVLNFVLCVKCFGHSLVVVRHYIIKGYMQIIQEDPPYASADT